jgi:hypothetical protein
MLSEYEANVYACGIKSPHRQSVVCSEYAAYVLRDGRIESEPSRPFILKFLLVVTALLVSGWLVGADWEAADVHAPQVQQAA